MTTETFTIPVENLAKLRERIEKLNKRARKIGVPEIKLTAGDRWAEQVEGENWGREVVRVIVEGEAPIINGWAFIATLEHDEDGTVIRRIPTFSEHDFDLTQYRTATPDNCDHCGYKRRRNDTYIVGYVEHDGDHVADDTVPAYGETKQVGSNCLKDFTGHESPHLIAKQMEMVRDLLDELRGGGYSEGGFVPRFSARDYMATVVTVARELGFVSKKSAWEENKRSTAEIAADALKRREVAGTPSDSDYAWADKIIEWAENLSEKDLDNDYLWNVHTVLKNGSLTARQFGIAASATQAYKRAKQERGKDEYLGVEGERVTIRFSVERSFDNIEYTTYVLRDSEGHSLKWSTQKQLALGEAYEGSFKIKAHIEGRYGKVTMIHYPRDLERV